MSSSSPGRRRAPSAPVRRRRATVTAALVVLAVAAIWFHAARSDAKRLPGRTATAAGQTAGGGTPVAAALFSPGACVSFPPTAGDRHQTVFIDAGHGGIDPGATGTTESGADHPRGRLDPARGARHRAVAAGPRLPGGGVAHRRHLGRTPGRRRPLPGGPERAGGPRRRGRPRRVRQSGRGHHPAGRLLRRRRLSRATPAA